MEARLRSARTLPGTRPDQDKALLTGGNGPTGIDEDGSDDHLKTWIQSLMTTIMRTMIPTLNE
jgi:hypothetical protein